jgi:PAS domain S-box-containing protein
LTKYNYTQSFEDLRNSLLNDFILGIAVIGTPAAIISTWRIFMIGFQNFMLVNIALVFILWGVWIRRAHLLYRVRTFGLLFSSWLVIFGGLITFGPVADGKSFILLFPFSCMLFATPRSAWILIVSFFATLVLVAIAAVQHWLQFDLDYQVWAHHPTSWGLLVWTAGGFGILAAYIGWRMVDGLRKHAEISSELAERLKRVADRIPGMICQYRVYPDRTASFPYASDAIETLFGVTADMVKDDASPLLSSIHKDDQHLLTKAIMRSAFRQSLLELEFRVITKEGKTLWYRCNGISSKLEDGSYLWHGFVTDYTVHKKLEVVKDEFISMVSHELRTPLTSISGALKLINNDVLADDDDQKKDLLQVAEKNADRLLYLINDLLHMEQLEAGTIELKLKSVGLLDLITDCMTENQVYAEQYGSALQLVQCDGGEIFVDEQRMTQVLTNLISNACKFSPENSTVEIRATRAKGLVVIAITDYGMGIPQEFQSQLFEKFTQAESSSTRNMSGTGLGLSIAKKIMELHGGRIEFKSEANTGTCFSLVLPVKNA